MIDSFLDTPVKFLAKVGPKYEKLLEKLEIFTIEDLVYHFPFRYEDYSHKITVKDASVGDTGSVTGLLGKVTNISSLYGKKLTISQIVDSTGNLELIWFNQHYLKKVLKEGGTYTVSGKITSYKGKKCIFSPEFEEEEGKLTTGRLVGIYPETAGISSKWLRSRNNDVINSSKPNHRIDEFLPAELLSKFLYPNRLQGLKSMHFPENISDAEKARKRFEFEELFLELLKVERRKEEWQKEKNGWKIDSSGYKKQIQGLINSLKFKLTTSQENALENIFSDLQKEVPMNRLLEGDVGSGKTIVSLIASYLSYLNGYKSVLMAPTEILTAQHFETYKSILNNFDPDIKIIQKTSFRKGELKKGFDIAVGTHALLYSETQIPNLGLVIVDEQHRFGVEQRTLLLNMTLETVLPNMLSMTATPIPRTLSLTLYGDLDISVLKPHTKEGRKVQTKVVTESNRERLYQWLLAQDQPTFIVCPFIEQSQSQDFENVKAAEKEFVELQKILPVSQMKLVHGRMKNKDKQEAIQEFKEGKVKYLVSTPVIEVGIDVPEASIMIIESAERYGLASLHQLRGRVGRAGQAGYCFLVCSKDSHKARLRLKYMETMDDGMDLAEIDLKMRGQGDIFGTMQSGVKKFKVANVFNVDLLEQAKLEVQNYYGKLNQFPLLEQKIEKLGKHVGQN